MPKQYCPSLEWAVGPAKGPEDEKWAKGLPIGQRIEIAPACDLWMRGARFGTILEHGSANCRVAMDGLKGHKRLPYGLIFAALT